MTTKNLPPPVAMHKGIPIYLSPQGEFTAHNSAEKSLTTKSLAAMKTSLDKAPVKPNAVDVISVGFYGLTSVEITGEGVMPRKSAYGYKTRQFEANKDSEAHSHLTGYRVNYTRCNDALAEPDAALVAEYAEMRTRQEKAARDMQTRHHDERETCLSRVVYLTDDEIVKRLYSKDEA